VPLFRSSLDLDARTQVVAWLTRLIALFVLGAAFLPRLKTSLSLAPLLLVSIFAGTLAGLLYRRRAMSTIQKKVEHGQS